MKKGNLLKVKTKEVNCLKKACLIEVDYFIESLPYWSELLESLHKWGKLL